MNASVIVLSWNGMEFLENCLNAVLSQDDADLEVIVVDNGSSDGSADFVEAHYPDLRLIRNQRNLGFSAGNNVGLRAARGDVLVLLNQDTVVQPGWLGALAQTFQDPTVGIAGCKALYPDGTIQHAGGFVYGPRAETDHIGRYDPDDAHFDELGDVDFVTGAALGISRDALSKVGLLDEGFCPAYYEDVDWCYTTREAGLRVVYNPSARLIHLETPTAQREGHAHKHALHQGRLRFVFKHWGAERLVKEFIPAERAWASSLGRTVEMMSARRAYLVAMLDTEAIASFRTRSDGVASDVDPNQEVVELLSLLDDLRGACVTRETALDETGIQLDLGPRASRSAVADKIGEQSELIPRRASQFAALRARQEIRERRFTSDVPVVGPVIAGLRQIWHDFAVRWSLLPLLHQQSEFNAELSDLLSLLMEMDDQLRMALQYGDQELRRTRQELHRTNQELMRTRRWNEELERDVAENIREINELAGRLAAITTVSPGDDGTV